MTMKRLLLILLLLSPSLFAADGATTVILVRHAETAGDTSSGGTDPGLSEAGQARAKALATVARDAHVSAAIVSQYRRTKETAAELKVPSTEVPVERGKAPEQAAAIAKRIAEEHRGKTVVVVGHSNTIPVIVTALSGVAAEEIAHAEYDRLYVVVLEDGKAARVIVTRYGG